MNNKGIWDDREFGYAHAHSETLAIAVAKIIGSSNKFDEKINCEEWPVYDLGCGNGWYTSFLKANGFKCIGYDGNPGNQTDDDIRRFDLTDKLVLNPKGTILCLEVAEHIPKQYEDALLDNIVRNCSGKVILSWAVPGQGGLGHVNEQPNWYVVEKFRSLGFAINGTQIEFLRAAVKNDACWWFKNTLLVFDRLPSSAENSDQQKMNEQVAFQSGFHKIIHDTPSSVSVLTHSLRELQNPYSKEEHPAEEKRNIHWFLYLSDDYQLMVMMTPDLPADNPQGKPSDPATMFTGKEIHSLNKLFNEMKHPVFSSSMDKDKLNHKLKEFEERIIQIMKNDKV